MVMRVGGLASGMDIDALVEKLMQAEKAPLNKLQQQKQTYEWQRDAYRNVNTKLKTFDTYIADNLVLKTLNSKTVTSSNSGLVSATATGQASGTLSIESVSRLATAARGVGGQTNATGDTNLSTYFAAQGENLPSSIELQSIDKNGQLGEKTKIEITSSMSIQDFVSAINNSSAGVSAIFENGQLSITAKNTGKEVNGGDAIQANDAGKALFATLGLGDGTGSIVTEEGKNAIFQVNGIVTERTSNTFNINGYNVTLNAPTTSTGEKVTLTATTNTDDMVAKIKDFVNTYNGLIKDLNDQMKQSKYRDYAPLTEEQKKEMDENDIKLWEEKAKSGLLRNDSIVRNGLADMRSIIYQTNPAIDDTKFNSLFSIGITTSKSYNDGGTLEIDEDKLRKAIEENPDAVEKLFKNTSGKADDTIQVTDPVTGTVSSKKADTRGFLEKLRASMKTFEVNIDQKAGRSTMTDNQYTIGKNIVDTDKRIDTWKSKLEMIEARYWKQFTAMETAINKANQQSSMFFSQQSQ